MVSARWTAPGLFRVAACLLTLVIAAVMAPARTSGVPNSGRNEPVPEDDSGVAPVWTADLKTAVARAKADAEKKRGSGLVLVVVVHGQCGYCNELDKGLFIKKKVIAATSRTPFVREKVGGDEIGVVHDSAFAKEHKTPFTPTFYLVDGSGKVIDRSYGVPTPDELVAWLVKGEKDLRAFPGLETRVKERPDDLSAVGRYAAGLAARGRVNEAVALVKKAEGDKGEPIAALAPAYNRIGDAHFEAVWKQMCELYGSFEKYEQGCPEAVRWFKKTVEASKDPEHLAYARYGLGTCAFFQGKPQERVAIFKEIMAMPNAPALLKKRIEMSKFLTKDE